MGRDGDYYPACDPDTEVCCKCGPDDISYKCIPKDAPCGLFDDCPVNIVPPTPAPVDPPTPAPVDPPTPAPVDPPTPAPVDPPPATGNVTGTVFEDSNNNGMRDPGEPGILGVIVVITDSSGAKKTLTTDSDGGYSATVPTGPTVIKIVAPPDSVQTSGFDPTTVVVIEGQTATDLDGFHFPPSPTPAPVDDPCKVTNDICGEDGECCPNNADGTEGSCLPVNQRNNKCIGDSCANKGFCVDEGKDCDDIDRNLCLAICVETCECGNGVDVTSTKDTVNCTNEFVLDRKYGCDGDCCGCDCAPGAGYCALPTTPLPTKPATTTDNAGLLPPVTTTVAPVTTTVAPGEQICVDPTDTSELEGFCKKVGGEDGGDGLCCKRDGLYTCTWCDECGT